MATLIQAYKSTTIPSAPYQPSTFYFVENDDPLHGKIAETYLSNAAGDTLYLVGNSPLIDSKVSAALASLSEIEVVADIAARDALTTPTSNKFVFVENASADATVTSGAALYLYNVTGAAWVKAAEYEGFDENLAGLVHANRAEIDKIGETTVNSTTIATYDGEPVMRWMSEAW